MMAMRWMVRPSSALFVLLVVTATQGQELLCLSDGSSVDARVQRTRGKVRLKSAFGEREGPTSMIVQTRSADELRRIYKEQAAEIPKGFLRAHFALAQWCAENGLLSGAKEQLEAILKSDIDHVEAQQLAIILGESWTSDPLERSTRERDQDDLARAFLRNVAPRSRVDAVIAAHKAASMPLELRLRPALKALKHQVPWVRWVAARLLTDHRNEPERIVPLYRACLADPALLVRREATRALKVTQDPTFVRLFAKNLRSPDATVRTAAAEALGEFGSADGIAPLIEALSDTWRPARNFIASTTQRAYVKDFDVEVAQGAVIADPIIDVVQEGAVLDVAVVSVNIERTIYSTALMRLSGAQLGEDPAAWRAWYKNR